MQITLNTAYGLLYRQTGKRDTLEEKMKNFPFDSISNCMPTSRLHETNRLVWASVT